MYSQNSQCELLVRRAAKHGGRRIQFVPTHYWYEKVNEQYPANTCLPDNWSIQNKVDWYCTKFEWNSDCRPFDQGAIDAFKTGFTKCLKVCARIKAAFAFCAAVAVPADQCCKLPDAKYVDRNISWQPAHRLLCVACCSARCLSMHA